ncbi:hypothetical protein HN014_04435 [Aquimarina sp. TRL1]|uniref:hypothetical protein n=1 Tax=Aquimarina sp. (strain TRL1) TaxID=2736252 RepID=UPI00158A4534|nr:hypothetical protein [Aquimarina sp. TRL1]QKX04186.1 hypothetical protein HN014_04435 [Aquimarina sp. TRL1]
MKQKIKKTRSGLAEKLKNAVQNLNVDVFGYESKVTKNILRYFSKLSKETDLVQEELVVRIFKDWLTINVAVYNQGRPVKKISVKELITLFTNSEPSGLFNLEAKVVRGIENFMSELSDNHHIEVEQLQICIVASSDKVWVKGYKGLTHIQDIPLGVLIKHFTQ